MVVRSSPTRYTGLYIDTHGVLDNSLLFTSYNITRLAWYVAGLMMFQLHVGRLRVSPTYLYLYIYVYLCVSNLLWTGRYQDTPLPTAAVHYVTVHTVIYQSCHVLYAGGHGHVVCRLSVIINSTPISILYCNLQTCLYYGDCACTKVLKVIY